MSAWPAIRAAAPHATLDVVGVGPLAELVHGDGVRALGRVRPDEIAGLYADAAAVVVPSRRDSFSLACLEAMATARPVVCTPVGDMAGRVRDGVDGHRRAARRPGRGSSGGRSKLLADPAAAEAMGLEARTPGRGALLVGRDRARDARGLRGRDRRVERQRRPDRRVPIRPPRRP